MMKQSQKEKKEFRKTRNMGGLWEGAKLWHVGRLKALELLVTSVSLLSTSV